MGSSLTELPIFIYFFSTGSEATGYLLLNIEVPDPRWGSGEMGECAIRHILLLGALSAFLLF